MSANYGSVFEVPPIRWAEIQNISQIVRDIFCDPSERYFPVDYAIEIGLTALLKEDGYYFDVHDKEFMGAVEGETDPRGNFIRLREDVYENLGRGEGRARFTAAHEMGHFFLHRNIPMQRASERNLVPFRNSEAQANHFAACLLMPEALITQDMSANNIMTFFGVSFSAAQNRIKYIRKQRGGPFSRE